MTDTGTRGDERAKPRVRDGRDPLFRWLSEAYAATTDGQRWTLATCLVITALFLGFGLRRAVEVPVTDAIPNLSSPAVSTSGSAAGGPPTTVAPVGPSGHTSAGVPSQNTSTAGSFAGSSGAAPASAASAPSQTGADPGGGSATPVAGPKVFASVGDPGAPGGLAVLPDGGVAVTTDNGSTRGRTGPSVVFEFNSRGHGKKAITISGQPANHKDGLGAAAVSPLDGKLYVVDVDDSSVLRIDPATGSQAVAVTVANVAPCVVSVSQAPCEPGVIDHQPALSALAFDPSGNLYIADAGQATIWRWHPGESAPESWYSSTDLATGDGPSGLSLAADRSLLFTAGSTLDTANPDAGGLYRLGINGDGTAGSRSLVSAFSTSDNPGPVATGPDGSIYVVLRGSGTMDMVHNGQTAPFPTGGTSVPVDSPSALAVSGGRLLVANGLAASDPTRWAVLSFPVAGT